MSRDALAMLTFTERPSGQRTRLRPVRRPVGTLPTLRAPVPLNRQQPFLRVIHLECRVLDVEALVQHPLERAADSMTVRALRDEDVRGENRMARCRLPHVQVVDFDDLLGMRHRQADVAADRCLRARLRAARERLCAGGDNPSGA